MKQKLQALGIQVKEHHHGNVKIPCPRCSSSRKHKTDPCLSVDVEHGIWNCHHCSWSGAVKRQHKEYTLPPKELTKLNEQIIKWFGDRGISNQTLLRYGITEGVDYMPQVGHEVRTIHFNYYQNGELVNIKYRDSSKNFKLVSGAAIIPYGIDVADYHISDSIILTEGEIDCLSFYEAGVKGVISLPNGASRGKIEWLDDWIHIFDNKKIYLACDTDEAGVNARNELARRLGKENCLIVDFPCKDANETLVKYGPERLVQCIENATPFPIEGIDDAYSVSDDLFSLYDDGMPTGYDSGFDDMLWNAGQVTLVTGIPGHGKSTWIKNLILRLAQRHGLVSFIYSAEEANTAFALSDMVQMMTGKPFFAGQETRVTRDELEACIPFLNDHFKYYRMSDNDMTIEAILEKGKSMVRQYGIDIMVIDNLSTVEKSMSNQSDTRHHQIKNMLGDMSRFAKNYGVHILLVAHPKKMNELKPGIYRVPNGYDVSDSSYLYNLPDNGLTVYRNMETRQTEVHRWKIRFKHTGQLGTSYYHFNVKNSLYEPTEKLNDGSDKTKFVLQPEAAKNFASLSL